ncbi:FtsX-like permease family protein [Actinopolymorpha alba]|uniref:FtsX-like permease family protein n=1 Tax=Actinopolymorpha alba TaxID=533267 RepID=UPI00037E7392|nr:FtsX-like permease family protein [Actinopolymorpha alba]
MTLGSWRLALRLGRREIGRSKARSLLIAAMVGVPVLLVTALAVVARTAWDVPPAEQMLRALGAADALVTVHDGPVIQDPRAEVPPTPDAAAPSGSPSRTWTAQDVAGAVDGRVLPLRIRGAGALIETADGALATKVRELDLRDPLTKGLARILDGRAPAARGEVAISPALVDRGYRIGDHLDVGANGERRVTVVGVVRNPADLKGRELLGLPGTVLGDDAQTSYLVDTGGAPITWATVRDLNRAGLTVQSRAVLLNPPPDSEVASEFRRTEGGTGLEPLAILVAACLVLEVVLLAGPAFAVGARRQSRQLALLVAAGASARDVRRVVLGQALALGALIAVGAAGAGILVVVAVRPLVESLVGTELGRLRVHGLDLLLIVGVAILATLTAALAPARQAARQDTLTALAGRRGDVRTRAGWPIAGLVLAGAGVAVVFLGGTQASGGEIPVVLGTLGLATGAIMLTPSIIGGLGRLGDRLPLSLRLATRDSARHRGRTAPAVAAIMGAVIGVTALAIGSASDFAESRRDYTPQERMGTLAVYLNGAGRDHQVEALVARLRAELPTHSPRVVRAAGGDIRDHRIVGIAGCRETRAGCGNTEESFLSVRVSGMLVADAATVEALTGRALTSEQRAVLARGGVLVSDPAQITTAGTTRVKTYHPETAEDGTGTEKDRQTSTVPAAVLAGAPNAAHGEYVNVLAELVGTEETAQRLGLHPRTIQILLPPTGTPITKELEERVDEIVQGLLPQSTVYVERGFVQSYTPILAILGGIGGLIVLVGTATATALALDDARPDFATLAAVGASPRTRRRTAMAQAAVIAGLGVLLGVAVGSIPGLAVTWPLTAGSPGGHIIAVPWQLLGLVAVAVPLVAVAGAGIFTRSRLVMMRRSE